MGGKAKLFCIPYAGGTADFFDGLINTLAGEIEGFSTDYPGHGKRLKEPFCATWDALLRDVAEQINTRLEPEDSYVLFGYSMGSILAYDLLSEQMLNIVPTHVFFASHAAPHIEWPSKQYYKLDDEALLEVLRPKGGFDKVNADLIRNRLFRRMFFLPMRADYDLIGQYRMKKDCRIDLPATVLYAGQDVPTEEAHTWDRFLRVDTEWHDFSGKHFFLREHTKEVADLIKSSIIKR